MASQMPLRQFPMTVFHKNLKISMVCGMCQENGLIETTITKIIKRERRNGLAITICNASKLKTNKMLKAHKRVYHNIRYHI